MLLPSRYVPDLIIWALLVLIQALAARWIVRGPGAGMPVWMRAGIRMAAAGSILWLTLGLALRSARVANHFSSWWVSWVLGGAISWGLLSAGLLAVWLAVRRLPAPRAEHNSARRNFLRVARAALFAAPAVALGYGTFVERFRIGLREVNIPVAGLPKELDGLRLVQLTDIHLGAFLSERELARAVDMANETRAHVALVTGDLISLRGDPLDACLAQLARLRAESGTLGCLGNHEIYAAAEDYATAQGARLGIRFLRSQTEKLEFGGRQLNFAGVDYQRFRHPYLAGAERLIEPGAVNILLSHNPDVLPVAARQGWHLTIAGHTHGGQVTIEILTQGINMARFFTPYVDGLYREGASTLFVSRGIGTIGLPARLGAPPEVALLRLCAT